MFHDFDREHIQLESPRLLNKSVEWLEQLAEILHASEDESYDDLKELIVEVHDLLDLVKEVGYPKL